MEKIQKEQAKDLNKLHEKTDYLNKIKMLSEDNRANNERIRDLEAKLRTEHEEKRDLRDKVYKLEYQVEEYENMVSQKSGQFVKKDDLKDMRVQIDKLSAENISYKKINEGQATKFLKERSRHLKENTQLENTIKDKDREISILKLKIKDQERTFKHSEEYKLKPVIVQHKRSKSTMKRVVNRADLELIEQPYESPNGNLIRTKYIESILRSREESIRLPSIKQSKERAVFETPKSKRFDQFVTEPESIQKPLETDMRKIKDKVKEIKRTGGGFGSTKGTTVSKRLITKREVEPSHSKNEFLK